jgi:hypothetical protein
MRHLLSQTWVRPILVVMGDELPEDVLEMPPTEDQQVVKQLAPNGAHPAFGKGVRPRGPVGDSDDPHPFAGEDLVKSRRKLGISIAEQEAGADLSSLEAPGQVAGLLGDPGGGRMSRAATQVDAPAPDFEEEQHVKLLEPGCLHRKEVNGQNLLGMLVNEVAPAEAGAPGSRADSVPPQDVANGQMRTGTAQLDQLTLNASVAPAWVLASQA